MRDPPPQPVVLDDCGGAFPPVARPAAGGRRPERICQIRRRVGPEAAHPGGSLPTQLYIERLEPLEQLTQLTTVGQPCHCCVYRSQPVGHLGKEPHSPFTFRF
jgi:hypothetical protein